MPLTNVTSNAVQSGHLWELIVCGSGSGTGGERYSSSCKLFSIVQPSSAKRNLDEICLTLVYSGAQTSPQYCSCAMHVANFALHIVH